ncbi:FAD-dependent oxidoreductase [Reichenbachiella agarivorans]|uniref:FAD-dependent oxidoreductase n=1 Tax=Reichenbachiella agarivorans TaxID=2979464 RepID=A0ABY6CRA6_9BACT|nr:FAD-dependent oxidoreductase [Reichenbachiella agarivorans]UXP33042.1 FAD-dependent oxidoreductase [Reichenbachiella agarivorans]
MREIKTDIAIVGGGVAGFAAAMSAAEFGVSVILLEKENELGGNAVLSNVGTICGAYYHADAVETISPVDHPFLKKVLQDIVAQPIIHHDGLVVVPYRVNALRQYMEEQLKLSAVQVHYGANVIESQLQNHRISSIVMEAGGETIRLLAKSYVDCSGRGVLSGLAGLEMIRSATYQRASQVFKVKGVTSSSEYALNFAIRKTLFQTMGDKTNTLVNTTVIPGSLVGDCVDLKFTLPCHVTDQTTQDSLNELGRKLVGQVFSIIQSRLESFAKASIDCIYPQAGIRVLQRSKGHYILTENDVLTGRKLEGSPVIATWPIEEWDQSGRAQLSNIADHGFYHIPLDCLQSCFAENLYFAGKNISATDRAIGSARVIGTCLQTGYEAGKLALNFSRFHDESKSPLDKK